MEPIHIQTESELQEIEGLYEVARIPHQAISIRMLLGNHVPCLVAAIRALKIDKAILEKAIEVDGNCRKCPGKQHRYDICPASDDTCPQMIRDFLREHLEMVEVE